MRGPVGDTGTLVNMEIVSFNQFIHSRRLEQRKIEGPEVQNTGAALGVGSAGVGNKLASQLHDLHREAVEICLGVQRRERAKQLLQLRIGQSAAHVGMTED